ncbi:MAG: hypothetical protein Q4A55_05445 [Aerococcus sp.]|nr:hypothetical protein [Aerococcus sp.]
MKNIKKMVSATLIALTLFGAAETIASAATVYYKDTPVYWEYGRRAGLWSYSDVQSHHYEHSATANGAFSGWKPTGTEAYITKFIGTGTAECYWDCR